jgi:uncharacterized protein YbjT (DUF2867 family)
VYRRTYARAVPVIVVGADTPLGRPIVAALLRRDGEVRAFVTDPVAAEDLRAQGVKVALGDVSDASHVGGAAINAFCAVAVLECVVDARARAFAATGDAAVAAWGAALAEAGVSRVIVVPDGGGSIDPSPLRTAVREYALVATAQRSPAEIAAEVAELDELADLPD